MTQTAADTQLAWIRDRQAPLVDRLLSWTAQNSGSRNRAGLAAMADMLVPAFEALGGRYECLPAAEVLEVDDRGEPAPAGLGPVHRFVKRPEARRRIVLTGHLDTVFPADHPFQEARWLDDVTLNAPGAADMKGGLLVMLTALEAMERADWPDKPGFEVLISSDEEIGSMGSDPYLRQAAARGHIGLTYEPALPDGSLAGARKGSGNFTLVVDGRAAHAGRAFHDGRNAIEALAEAIRALYALNGTEDGVTVNPALIRGGTAPNIVPDRALCRFNIRVKDRRQSAWAQGEVERIVADIDGRDGFAARLYGGFNRPPKPLSQANRALMAAIAACGRALDLDLRYQDTGGVCEGNNLADAGLPNVDTLGVRGGAIHSTDEFMKIDSLTERAALSYLVMRDLAEGRFDAWLPQR